MTASLLGRPGTAAAAVEPDSELIGLCQHLVAIETALAACLAARRTLADEHRTQPAVDRLYAAQEAAFAGLEGLPRAVTPVGIRALARAALTLAPRNLDGSLIHAGDAEWLAFQPWVAFWRCPELRLTRVGSL